MAASTSITRRNSTSSLYKPYSPKPFPRPSKLLKFHPSPSAAKAPSIFCTLTRESNLQMEDKKDNEPVGFQRPDSFGRFGKFGGKYVPETLMYALSELESAFHSLAGDEEFQVYEFVLELVFLIYVTALIICIISGWVSSAEVHWNSVHLFLYFLSWCLIMLELLFFLHFMSKDVKTIYGF